MKSTILNWARSARSGVEFIQKVATWFFSFRWIRGGEGVEISRSGSDVTVEVDAGEIATVIHDLYPLNIADLAAFTDPQLLDLFIAYDLSATANKKITFNDFCKIINVLNSLGYVDKADLLMTYDTSDSSTKKATLERLFYGLTTLTNMGTTGLTPGNDYILVADMGNADARRLLPTYFLRETLKAETDYDADELQVLVNDNGAIKWINTTTCGSSNVAVGNYTGDGSTDQTVDTGLGAQIIDLEIINRCTAAQGTSVAHFYKRHDGWGTKSYAGYLPTAGNTEYIIDNAILALDADGKFHVSDRGIDENPNTNGQVYTYKALK